MNNITVTVELCAEDRARLDSILEALKQPQAKPEKVAEPVQEAAEASQTEAVEEPKQEKAEPEKPAEAEPAKPEEATAPTVTSADVRALVQKLVAPGTGKRDATREIVLQYAANVSDIPADKLAEAYAKLKALEVNA